MTPSKLRISDERYVIDLCDAILESTALRQHRFPFLLGVAGKAGRRARLPVDAYYAHLALVIEYREKQHHEPVAMMDKRLTISGISRGEQRKRYDQLRRTVLPQHGLTLIEVDYEMLLCTPRKRLRRNAPHDEGVLRRHLSGALVRLRR